MNSKNPSPVTIMTGQADSQPSKSREEGSSSSSSSRGEPISPEKQRRDAKRKLILLTDGAEVGNEITVKEDGSTAKKHVTFQRIWSEEHEKEIFKALAEFVRETNSDPYKEVNAFHEFLRTSKPECVETSTVQLKEKIRRMRRKFTNSIKGKSKSKFDLETLQLAQKVWGKKAGSTLDERALGFERDESAKDSVSVVEKMFGLGSMPMPMPMDEELWKSGIRCLPESKVSELAAKWKKLRIAEMELYAKRMELLAEQALAIVEAIKSRS